MASSAIAKMEKPTSQALFDLPDVVTDTLRCSNCGLYLSCGPIRCKADGDGICGRCMPRGDNANETYRSFLYEKSMAAMKFPCIYDKFGCVEKLPFNQVTVHENNCQFKQVVCPSLSDDCKWEGSIKDLREHIEQHDLILKKNTFEIDTKQDLNDQNAVLTVKDDIAILLRYKYVSKEKILYFEAVHFFDDICEIICNLKFVNKDDRSLYACFKAFNCKPYVSKYVDLERVQKIDFNKFMPCLEYPMVVIIKVFCECKSVENYHLRPSSKKSLAKILCSVCCTYMVPPIVKNLDCFDHSETRKISCKNCSRVSSSLYEELNDYCKELNYPCKWKCCHFVGKHYNIRQHELNCNHAKFDCPLSCDGNFNLRSFMKHLNEAHDAERFCDKITIAPTSEGIFRYRLFDDQLLILQIASSCSKIDIKHFNLVANNDKYKISYYFIHSHCEAPTEFVTVYTAKPRNREIQIDVVNMLKPSCFQKYNEGFSIVIDGIEKL